MATPRGYSASKDQVVKKLRRIEGQVRGIEGMVNDERYCIDIITQISAIHAALDKVALNLVDGHIKHCVHNAAQEGRMEEVSDELMQTLARLMGRK